MRHKTGLIFKEHDLLDNVPTLAFSKLFKQLQYQQPMYLRNYPLLYISFSDRYTKNAEQDQISDNRFISCK